MIFWKKGFRWPKGLKTWGERGIVQRARSLVLKRKSDTVASKG